MTIPLKVLSVLPLIPPLCILFDILSNDIDRIARTDNATHAPSSVGAQLLLFISLGVLGYAVTNHLIPSIQYYMLKRGISGKDLGKKGTKNEDVDV